MNQFAEQDELLITFTGEPGDPLENRRSNAAGLREFSTSLEMAGISAVQRMYFRDGTGGSGTQLGQYLVPIASIAIPTLGHVLTAWIKARTGRKVHVRIGALSIEAGTAAEVEQLLPLLKDVQSKSAEEKGA